MLSLCSCGDLLCVGPHCCEDSFCSCLPSIRAVHVLDEHVWLEIKALIEISEGNSAKGPQLHVPAQQTGRRDLTSYRTVCGCLWQMLMLSNFERFGQQTWCLPCTSSTSISSIHILHKISQNAFGLSCCWRHSDCSLNFPVWSPWCKLSATGPARPKLVGPPAGPAAELRIDVNRCIM